MAEAVVLVVLMALVLVVVIALPAVGLWSLLVLLLSRPIVALVRARQRGTSGPVREAGGRT